MTEGGDGERTFKKGLLMPRGGESIPRRGTGTPKPSEKDDLGVFKEQIHSVAAKLEPGEGGLGT